MGFNAEIFIYIIEVQEGKTKTVVFTCIEDQVLVDWIKDHDMLFNKKPPDYKETIIKRLSDSSKY